MKIQTMRGNLAVRILCCVAVAAASIGAASAQPQPSTPTQREAKAGKDAGAPRQPQLPTREQMEAELATDFSATAADPTLKFRSQTARRLKPLLFQQSSFLISELRPWEKNPEALLLTKGDSKEHGIRPNAHTAFGLAMMYRGVRWEYPEGLSPEICRDKAIAILRFLLPTHGAGGQTCNDDKHWRDQWQSALWAERAGKAAWLLWDDLDIELKWQAARMIAHEANRFVGKTPPTNIKDDTKAEENAWNSTVIALAYNMFPDHPSSEQWRGEAIRWAINTLPRRADLDSTRTMDGKPLSEWLVGANIHDDYSLENHRRFHPDYMGAFRAVVIQRLVYSWGGNAPPEALDLNVVPVYTIMKKLTLPDGGLLYPNGQDWHIHKAPLLFIGHVVQTLFFDDPEAARFMRQALEATERMAARTPDAGIHLPYEFFFPSVEHNLLEMLAESYLLLREHGQGVAPISEDELWKRMSGCHFFETGQFAVLRTPSAASSFSWGSQIMGMALPLQEDLLISPNERSMIGMIESSGEKPEEAEKPVLKEIRTFVEEDSFAACAVIERAGGALEQRVGFYALPDGRTVYADALRTSGTAASAGAGAGELPELALGTIGILNEPRWIYHDGTRTLFHKGGEERFAATDADSTRPVELDSPWYNLDGELGMLCLKTTGKQAYIPRTKPTRGRVEQLLHLNYIPAAGEAGSAMARAAGIDADSGTTSPLVAESVLVFLPGSDVDATREAAAKYRVESPPGAGRTEIILDDGSRVVFDFDQLEATFESGAEE